jgi:hypothetical protein
VEGLLWLILIIVVICIVKANKPYNPEGLELQQEEQQAAEVNIICPHCQTKGSVTTQQVKKKVGISGGKATAAVMTCGLSMFATGLSRKNKVTEAHCLNCQSTWYF